MTSRDNSAELLEQVRQATLSETPLCISGGGSKSHLGSQCDHQTQQARLDMTTHTGVISHEPTELVVTVRSGTPLKELEQVLLAAGQMLPFEPPSPPSATIGGVLACGLSGPRRPFFGSARDYVLGTRVINGRAEDLRFGGEVMKNVAGYDVSRLQIGAFGTLGVLLDVSMKVLPLPAAEVTLIQSARPADTQGLVPLLRQPLPLSGAMLMDDRRYLRLSGSESAVAAAASALGGEQASDEEAGIWQQVRDHQHAFFDPQGSDRRLWRISVAEHAAAIDLPGQWLYDWAGAQRWLLTEAPAMDIYRAAQAVGGHATRYAAGPVDEPAFQPLSGTLQRLQSRLRDSFDPQRLFNRGRYHPELDESVHGSSSVEA